MAQRETAGTVIKNEQLTTLQLTEAVKVLQGKKVASGVSFIVYFNRLIVLEPKLKFRCGMASRRKI